jgi:predicted outer membrane repeat protein
LSFQNAGVHAYQDFNTRQVVIRNCDFRFIGGAVWHRERRIRFGNAIEFWDGASNITVEGCYFDNIYDSGVTHQGGETRNIPGRLHFRDNLFIDCGMAAYECREPSQEVYFEYNTCINAGGGFSMQGELPPRQSEIHPQPMGHHVFIWRIEPNTQPGHVYIRHNVFCEAPYGAAIYSIIDPADEKQFILDHNSYHQTTGTLLIHLGGRSYGPSEFSRYQEECRQDRHSRVVEPLFVNAAQGDYRQCDSSPCRETGRRLCSA